MQLQIHVAGSLIITSVGADVAPFCGILLAICRGALIVAQLLLFPFSFFIFLFVVVVLSAPPFFRYLFRIADRFMLPRLLFSSFTALFGFFFFMKLLQKCVIIFCALNFRSVR